MFRRCASVAIGYLVLNCRISTWALMGLTITHSSPLCNMSAIVHMMPCRHADRKIPVSSKGFFKCFLACPPSICTYHITLMTICWVTFGIFLTVLDCMKSLKNIKGIIITLLTGSFSIDFFLFTSSLNLSTKSRGRK
jgi:hypothetical protein